MRRSATSTRPALRLSRYFGATDRFWLNLQARLDLEAQKE
jgi:plasmid maintenance system antidote protein VapI